MRARQGSFDWWLEHFAREVKRLEELERTQPGEGARQARSTGLLQMCLDHMLDKAA